MNENQHLVECKVAGRIAKICERLRERFVDEEISMKHFVGWIWYLSCKFGGTYFNDYHTPGWVYGVMNRYWTWQDFLDDAGMELEFAEYLKGYCEGLIDALAPPYSNGMTVTSSNAEDVFWHPVPKDYEFKSAVVVRV